MESTITISKNVPQKTSKRCCSSNGAAVVCKVCICATSGTVCNSCWAPKCSNQLNSLSENSCTDLTQRLDNNLTLISSINESSTVMSNITKGSINKGAAHNSNIARQEELRTQIQVNSIPFNISNISDKSFAHITKSHAPELVCHQLIRTLQSSTILSSKETGFNDLLNVIKDEEKRSRNIIVKGIPISNNDNEVHSLLNANGSNLYPSVNALNHKSNDFCMSPTSPMSTKSIRILLHDVEGLNFLLSVGYLTFLQEFDVILLNETLCTDSVALRGFQCVNINAVLKGKGRPSGGIVIILSSAFTDWRVLETDNCLCVGANRFQ
ncbi:hypothetical protein GJ496_008014 [Pomphorhynchus laevis]|nr:hypothetical protein GJ496_008014 [Pomphorhynchus laevis]